MSKSSYKDLVIGHRWHLLEPIGAGGMAEVYRAKDTQCDCDVAVKLLRPDDDATDVSRFEREAKLLTSFKHPNLIKVLDAGRVDEDLYYYVMEVIEGKSLRQLLKEKGSFPKEKVRELICQVASALQCAHQAGIVHRDIKPSNVMMRNDGTVALIDFGVARIQKGTQLTKTGYFIGTIHYAAPEVLRGIKADSRTDVFALGVMTYELLTGKRPFPGKSLEELAAQIAISQPKPLPKGVSGPGSFWQEFIDICLAKEPDERLRDGQAVVDYLEEPQAVATVAVEDTSRRSLGQIFCLLFALFSLLLYVYRSDNPNNAHAIVEELKTEALPGGYVVTWKSHKPYKSIVEVIGPSKIIATSNEEQLNHSVLISGLPEGKKSRFRLVFPSGETSLIKEARTGQLAVKELEVKPIPAGGWLMSWQYPDGLVKGVNSIYRNGAKKQLKAMCNGGQWNTVVSQKLNDLEDIELVLTLANDKERAFSLKSFIGNRIRKMMVRLDGFDERKVASAVDVDAPRTVKNNMEIVKTPIERREFSHNLRGKYFRREFTKAKLVETHKEFHALSPLLFQTNMFSFHRKESAYKCWAKSVLIYLYARAKKAKPPIEPPPIPDFGPFAMSWRADNDYSLMKVLKKREPFVYLGPRKALTDYDYETKLEWQMTLSRVCAGQIRLELNGGRYFVLYLRVNGNKPLLIIDFLNWQDSPVRTAFQKVPKEYLKLGENRIELLSRHLFDVLSHQFTQLGEVSFLLNSQSQSAQQ